MMPICKDKRECYHRQRNKWKDEAYCDALDSTYEKSGRCPFCKKRPEDIGKREGE